MQCSNQYAIDRVKDPNTGTDRIDHASMVAYIAASCPTHVIDGWSSLSRAIGATLANDVYSACHIAYYAELRAAMALMAAEGVGILNNRHVAIDATGNIQELPSLKNSRSNGTHAYAWPILRHWSRLNRSYDLIDNIYQPANVGLENWLAAMGSSVPAKAITREWIKVWGIDLALPEGDRTNRNLASYRPSAFRPPQLTTVDETTRFVAEMWQCFEPSKHGSFIHLEAHLLKRALTRGGVSFPVNEQQIQNLGLSSAENLAWLQLLNCGNEPSLFEDASRHSHIDSPRCLFQILSRATLLLSIATAAARRHLLSAGYTREDLVFWWHQTGVDRGLWAKDGEVDPIDIWADIHDYVGDLHEWLEQGPNSTPQSFQVSGPPNRHFFESMELIGIWGLIP